MDKDKGNYPYRINGFEQIKLFYEEFLWPGKFRFSPTHISFYMFLWHQCNRNQWAEWIKLPRDTGMQGSCIASRTTFYNVIHDLEAWKLIEYRPGVADKRTPEFKLLDLRIPLNGTHTIIHDGTHTDTDVVPDITYNNNTSHGVKNSPYVNSFADFKNEVQSIDFIDDVCNRMKCDRTGFIAFLNDWIAIKEISKDYAYSKANLMRFLLEDFQKKIIKTIPQQFTTLNPNEITKKNLRQ
jgi:hypothetical protein